MKTPWGHYPPLLVFISMVKFFVDFDTGIPSLRIGDFGNLHKDDRLMDRFYVLALLLHAGPPMEIITPHWRCNGL
jgi:hypothetical protein